MKKIKLTGKRGGYAIVDDNKYKLLNQYKWNHGAVGYATKFHIKKNGKYTRKTMQAFLIGNKKGFVIDHINRNKLDNRLKNLRHVDHTESALNKKQRKAKSGITGLYRTKYGWSAEIQFRNKKYYLGHFKDKEKGKNAIIKKKEQLHKNLYEK